MAYTAPDPKQFEGLEQASSYMAPLAAAQITLPAFLFSGPCTALSRLIYMNQCNPGQLMIVAATWLQVAEKYLAASDKLKEKTGAVDGDAWTGDDRDAFDGKADKVAVQLQVIGAFAMQVGISLFIMGTMLAIMVPLMLAVATSLMAFSVAYLTIRAIPNPISAIVAENLRLVVMSTAASSLAALTTLDNAIGVAAKTLGAFIGGNMTVSWAVMASQGNFVNPVNTLGSTGFSMLQGLSQLALRNLMAPGRAGASGTHLDKISKPLSETVSKANPFMQGFVGVQGVYNIGNNAAGDVNPDGPNAMTDAGIDVMGLDFIPNTFEDQARGSGDDAPTWSREPDADNAEGEG